MRARMTRGGPGQMNKIKMNSCKITKIRSAEAAKRTYAIYLLTIRTRAFGGARYLHLVPFSLGV